MHEERSCTSVEDPVAHVRVWWITETPKQPSMYEIASSVHHVEIGRYTEEEDKAAMLQNTSPSFCLTKKKTADSFTVSSFY